MFKKAERKQSKLRLALCGPSGSGKTYGALLIAKGMGGKIAVIDTEHGSASLYSHLLDFDTLELEAPYSPERYIEAIKAAEAAGYNTLVIDSTSHEWSGSGGCIEINDITASKPKFKGNSWAAWSETGQRHRAFIDCMLQSKMHIIATGRSKTETAQQEVNGRKSVVKLGMKTEQRDGFEYEFTVVLDIVHDGHIAIATKDRTCLFGENPFKITEKTGEKLMEFLDSGISFEETNKKAAESIEKEIEGAKLEISNALTLDVLKTLFAKHYKAFSGDEQTQAILKRVYDEQKAFLEKKDIPAEFSDAFPEAKTKEAA